MKGFIVWLVGMAVIWVPPCAIDAGLSHTPDVLTAHADAGTFVTSTAADGTTTIQTTTGSIVVTGAFSSPTGQRLTLERRLKSGLQVCTEDGPVCASLAGPWPSALRPVPYKKPSLAFLVQWQAGLPYWYFDALMYSIAWCLVVVGVVAMIIQIKKDDEDKRSTGQQVSDTSKTAS